MGIDLTLLRVVIIDEEAGYGYAHTMIDLFRRRELFDEIRLLPTTPAPVDFNSYTAIDAEGEQRYGKTTVDPYGDPLQCVKAGDLYTLAEHEGAQDTQDNRAAWAYLGALPLDTLIALYWH